MSLFDRSNKFLLVTTLLLVLLFNQQTVFAEKLLDYTEFLSLVDAERISKVIIQGQKIYCTDINNVHFRTIAPKDGELIKILREKGVRIESKQEIFTSTLFSYISMFIMLIMLGVLIFFMRRIDRGIKKNQSSSTKLPVASGIKDEQVKPQNNNSQTVNCSICGKDLKYLGEIGSNHPNAIIVGSESAFSALEQWRGLVCINCEIIYCNDCHGYDGLRPKPCTKCGTEPLPAQKVNLKRIGAI